MTTPPTHGALALHADPDADPTDRLDDAGIDALFPDDGGDRRRFDGEPRRLASLTPDVPRESRFRTYTPAQLHALPPLEWLVEGMIPKGGLAAIIGAPKSGKTFLTLDLANCVATGRPFLGHRTRQGGVCYLSAEGRAGLPARQAAWEQARSVRPDILDIVFILEGANLMEREDAWHLARATVDSLATPPALVVIDTLARVTPGAEENSATDVGLVVQNADYIRERTGAAVLIVHHTNATGERERGSTALRGAVDVLLMVADEDGQRVLSCEAIKDGEPFPRIAVDLVPVTLPDGQTSVVPYRSGRHWSDGPQAPTADTLTENHVKALAALEVLGPAGAAATVWQKAAGIPERSFYRAKAALSAAGYIVEDGARSKISPSGIAALFDRRQRDRMAVAAPDESAPALPRTATVPATNPAVTATAARATATRGVVGGKGGELPSSSKGEMPLRHFPLESSTPRTTAREASTATGTATANAATATRPATPATRGTATGSLPHQVPPRAAGSERVSGRDRAAGAALPDPPPWEGPHPADVEDEPPW